MSTSRTGCICESVDSSSDPSYSHWIGELVGICVYDDAQDIIACIFIGIHLIAWFFLFFPQLRLNYIHRSAANLSLLYLSFWAFSEVCFLTTTILERWTWLWISHRIWRCLMVFLLLAQSVYYKFHKAHEFSAAVEAPYARQGRQTDAYLEQHDVDYDEPASMGWPTRLNTGRSQSNKSGLYGVQALPWGTALLAEGGGGTPPPHPSGEQLGTSPARSRLPSSHAHLSSAAAPRTISPVSHSPLVTQQRSSSKGTAIVSSLQTSFTLQTSSSSGGGSSPIPSSASQVGGAGSITSSASIPSIDNERRRAAYAAQQHSSKRSNPGSLSSSPVPFQPSPTSAFHPVVHVQPQQGMEQSFSTLNRSSSGGGGGGVAGKYTMFIMVMCIVGVAAYQSIYGPAPGTVHDVGSAHSRALLSVDSPLSRQPFDVTLFSSSLTYPNTTSSSICNSPLDPSQPIEILIRVFSWTGCACGALALFPQFIYNDSYMKSVEGLSFGMYGLMLIGNFALILGMSIPAHNDWLDNRYANENGAFDSWYLNQVILPILIVHAFNFMQIWVLVVQRAKYKKPEEPRRKRRIVAEIM